MIEWINLEEDRVRVQQRLRAHHSVMYEMARTVVNDKLFTINLSHNDDRYCVNFFTTRLRLWDQFQVECCPTLDRAFTRLDELLAGDFATILMEHLL